MSDELELIQTWAAATKARRKLPLHERALTGSGDTDLDNAVARIVLDTVQQRLPNYIYYKDGENLDARSFTPQVPRQLQLLPQHLFTIDWGASMLSGAWPEAYYVTFVPALGIRCITASQESDDSWGVTDLAIGWTLARRHATYGVQGILLNWWRMYRAIETGPWAEVTEAGSISKRMALQWRTAVWGGGGGREDDGGLGWRP